MAPFQNTEKSGMNTKKFMVSDGVENMNDKYVEGQKQFIALDYSVESVRNLNAPNTVR
jgi:hypothetical protein